MGGEGRRGKESQEKERRRWRIWEDRRGAEGGVLSTTVGLYALVEWALHI